MPGNGGAAEPFEDADLDFMRAKRDEAIKAGGKTVETFAGQSDDEVGVKVDTGVFAEPAKVLLGFGVVLPASDAGGDFFVECLDADFKLE